MEPLTHLVSTLAEVAYAVRREGSRVVFSPAPPPEHRPILGAWKAALPHALEEGERLPARELLRLERLACIVAPLGELPPMTWATFYYQDRTEPERVLVPGPNLLPSLLWRARNLPEPRRVHLAATDGGLILDLEAPLEAFLRVEGSGLEVYAWPEERMREYLQAAALGREPRPVVLELGGRAFRTLSWPEPIFTPLYGPQVELAEA